MIWPHNGEMITSGPFVLCLVGIHPERVLTQSEYAHSSRDSSSGYLYGLRAAKPTHRNGEWWWLPGMGLGGGKM